MCCLCVADKRKEEKCLEEAKLNAKEQKEDETKDKGDKPSSEPPSSSESAEQCEAPPSRVVPDTPTGRQTPPTTSGAVTTDSGLMDPELQEDPIVMAAKQTRPNDKKMDTFEKMYSVLSIDRSLCLLAAILPQDLSVSAV